MVDDLGKPLVSLVDPDELKQKEVEPVVGIDLGTTHSLVGVCEGEMVKILADASGLQVIPSVVGLDSQGVWRVGQDALNSAQAYPPLRSVKRFLGLDQKRFAQLCQVFGYPTAQVDGVNAFKLGDSLLTPVEVMAHILRHLWSVAKTYFGLDVATCVITVPAYFDEQQRQTVRQAARLLGIRLLRLLDEPTAAAIAYGLDHSQVKRVLVYDLGGGTFDVSLIRLHDGIFEVIAIGGDDRLGGDDFDWAIVDHLIQTHSLHIQPEQRQWIQRSVQRARLELSTTQATTIDCPQLDLHVPLTLAQLEEIISPLVERTIALTQQVIVDAGLAVGEIDKIILAGGATRTPLVKRLLSQNFDQELLDNLDPEQVVVKGATLHANQLVGNLSNTHLLLGVLPLSIGIETMGGIVEVILPRNSKLPAQLTQSFTTQRNNQTGMIFHVVQGERELSQDCRSLGRFELKGLPVRPAGTVTVEVKMEIDADGLLTVTAREPQSDNQVLLEVRPSTGLDGEKIDDMIKQSYLHAEEDHRQRLLREQKLQAQTTLAALNNLLNKKLTDDERAHVLDYCARIKVLLEQDSFADLADTLAQANNEAGELIGAVLDRAF